MIFRMLIISLVTIFSLHTINAMASMTVDGSLARAQTFLEQGQYFLALDEVNTAIQNKPSVVQQSRAYGMKGSLLLLMQHHEEAKQFLLKAFESSEDKQRKAGYANSLGVLYHNTDDMTRSNEYFETALALAGNNRSLALKIKLNQARSHLESTDLSHLDALFIEISAIDSATERTSYYLNLAETAKSSKPPFYSLAQKALAKAKADVLNINDKRLQLEILETLSDLYETQGRDQQALELSKQAPTLAGQINADDLMLQIEWRKGRIYQRQGRDDYALTAYGKAVDHVQAIRMDIPVEYEDGRSSFRETMEPIYLGYVHHLLKKSANQKEEAKQRTLRLARQTIEQIKQTELEDFLGGRCLIDGIQRNELDSIDDHAAILYPIILPDRLELLVGIGNTIHQYTVPIPEKSVHDAAKDLANNLRLWTVSPHEIKDSETYLQSSEYLYRWIIAPIQKDLTNAAIKTLVVVPDGVLRLVPFAAFYDGKHFLVEKYAISISPGMSLLGAKKNDQQRQNYRTLLAGVSKPGSVVEKLPKWVLSNLLQQDFLSENQQNLSGTRNIINSHSRSIADSNPLISHQDIEDFLKQTGMIEKLQEDLSLPGVEVELDTLDEELKNTTLFNESFTVKNFYQQISNQPFEIVHIATHGFFSSDADSSFLMAYDDILKLDDLQAFLTKNEKNRKSIQLLTFSACETAEGDDRAPLGFAGAALKANALSTLGSLWPISDEAAPVIMTSFYKHLLQSFSKAESLRQAQLEMLEDPDMSHPSFWSPFILVGNWL